jgi:hypothetical protein
MVSRFARYRQILPFVLLPEFGRRASAISRIGEPVCVAMPQ